MIMPALKQRLAQHIEGERQGRFAGRELPQDWGVIRNPVTRAPLALLSALGLVLEGDANVGRAATGAGLAGIGNMTPGMAAATGPVAGPALAIQQLLSRTQAGRELREDATRGFTSQPGSLPQRLMAANEAAAARHPLITGTANAALSPSNLTALGAPLMKAPGVAGKVGVGLNVLDELQALPFKPIGMAAQKLGLGISPDRLTPQVRDWLGNRAAGGAIGGVTGGANAALATSAMPDMEDDERRNTILAATALGAGGGAAIGRRNLGKSLGGALGLPEGGGMVARAVARQSADPRVNMLTSLMGSGIAPESAGRVPGPLAERLRQRTVAGNLDTFMDGAHPLLKNADGTPRRFYHGTAAGNFDQFTVPDSPGDFGRGVSFTDDPEYARIYAGSPGKTLTGSVNRADVTDAGPNLKPVYVNLKNPFVVGENPVLDAKFDNGRRSETLRDLGYDGVIVPARAVPGFDWIRGDIEELVVFDPATSVKSATGNSGAYDPRNPSLLGAGLSPEQAERAANWEFQGGIAKDRPVIAETPALTAKGAQRMKKGQPLMDQAKLERGAEYVASLQRGQGSGFPADPRIPVEVVGAARMMARGMIDFPSWRAEMMRDYPNIFGNEETARRLYSESADLFSQSAAAVTNPEAMPHVWHLADLIHKGLEREPRALQWYESTLEELQPTFGDDTPVFIEFLAATSPNNNVPGNVTAALKAYTEWKLGYDVGELWSDAYHAEKLTKAGRERWLTGGVQVPNKKGKMPPALTPELLEKDLMFAHPGYLPAHIPNLKAAFAGEAWGDVKVQDFLNSFYEPFYEKFMAEGADLPSFELTYPGGVRRVPGAWKRFVEIMGDFPEATAYTGDVWDLRGKGFQNVPSGEAWRKALVKIAGDKDPQVSGPAKAMIKFIEGHPTHELAEGWTPVAIDKGLGISALSQAGALTGEQFRSGSKYLFNKALGQELAAELTKRALAEGKPRVTPRQAQAGLWFAAKKLWEDLGYMGKLATDESGQQVSKVLEGGPFTDYVVPQMETFGGKGATTGESFVQGNLARANRDRLSEIVETEFRQAAKQHFGKLSPQLYTSLRNQFENRIVPIAERIPDLGSALPGSGAVRPADFDALVPPFLRREFLRELEAAFPRPGEFLAGKGQSRKPAVGIDWAKEWWPAEQARRAREQGVQKLGSGLSPEMFGAGDEATRLWQQPSEPFVTGDWRSALPLEERLRYTASLRHSMERPVRQLFRKLGLGGSLRTGRGFYGGGQNGAVMALLGVGDTLDTSPDAQAIVDGVTAAIGKAWDQEAATNHRVLRAGEEALFSPDDVTLAIDLDVPDPDAFVRALPAELGGQELGQGRFRVANFAGLPVEEFLGAVRAASDASGGRIGDAPLHYIVGNYIMSEEYDNVIQRASALLGESGGIGGAARLPGGDPGGTGGSRLGELVDTFRRLRDEHDAEWGGGAIGGSASFGAGLGPGVIGRGLAAAGRPALAGAGAGAAYGFFADEDDRLRGAAKGAVGGAVAGATGRALLPEIGSAVATAYRNAAPDAFDQSIVGPKALSIANRLGAQAMEQAGQVEGATLAELPRAVDDFWRARVVNTFRGLALDGGSLAILVRDFGRDFGVTPQDVTHVRGQLIDRFDDPDPIARLGDAGQIIEDWGLEGFIDAETGLQEVIGGGFGPAELRGSKMLSSPQRMVAGLALSFTNLRDHMIPVAGPIASAFAGHFAPYVDVAYRTLNNFQHAAPRLAFWAKAIQRDMPVAAQAFNAKLAPTGIDLSPLLGSGKPVRPSQVGQYLQKTYKGLTTAEVNALEREYAESLNIAAMKSADEIAKIFGDFRDKTRSPWKAFLSRIFPFSRYAMTMIPVWGRQAKRHPLITGGVGAGMLASGLATQRSGDAPWNAGTVPVSTETPLVGGLARARLGGQQGTVRLDPGGFLPSVVSGQTFAGLGDTENMSPYDMAAGAGEMVGLSPHPLLGMLANVAGQSRKPQGPMDRYANITNAAELVPGMPTVPSLQGPFDEVKSRLTGEPVREFEQVARRYGELVLAETGAELTAPQNRGLYAAMGDPDTPLWRQARQEVRLAGLLGGLLSVTSPVSTSGQSRESTAYRRAQSQRPPTYDPMELFRAGVPAKEAERLLRERVVYDEATPATRTYRGANTQDRYRALESGGPDFGGSAATRAMIRAELRKTTQRKDR